jgi:hypothetical protein
MHPRSTGFVHVGAGHVRPITSAYHEVSQRRCHLDHGRISASYGDARGFWRGISCATCEEFTAGSMRIRRNGWRLLDQEDRTLREDADLIADRANPG